MTLKKFESNSSANELSKKMFEHWRKTPIFEDAANILKEMNNKKEYHI